MLRPSATPSAVRRALDPVAALARTELFAGLPGDELADLARGMESRSFAPGDVLCRAGEAGDGLFVIVDGFVHLTDGASGRLVGKRRWGEVVGITALVTGDAHPATAVAGGPVLALRLQGAAFEALAGRQPRVLANLNRILAREVAGRRVERERGEVVALVAPPALWAAIPPAVEAARAASPRGVETIDVRGSLDGLARIDEVVYERGTVLLLADAGSDRLQVVVDHADRSVELPDGANPAWLGRELTATKLGLALGAGGAKGYAHVGTLQVLEEAGYTVDGVAGSSIGAIVGAYLALGMSATEIDTTLRSAFSEDNCAAMFKLALSGSSSGLDTVTRVFRETTDDATFADTKIPLTVMSVDLSAREPAPIREGPLWEALVAATALAGMFPPYERGGRRLVDGLALVPVPTGAAVEDGADVTVSVNLMSRETLPAWPGLEAPPPEPPRRGSRMLDTLLEVMDLAQLDNSVRHAAMADVAVTPRFGPGSWRDFHLADLFLAAGREAALEGLPALKQIALPT